MRLQTKWIKIRNREAGEFESFASAIINLETGDVN